eukprot:364398-Chlamydomonas_euryale.AAC.5
MPCHKSESESESEYRERAHEGNACSVLRAQDAVEEAHGLNQRCVGTLRVVPSVSCSGMTVKLSSAHATAAAAPPADRMPWLQQQSGCLLAC